MSQNNKNYTEDEIIREISQKHDIRIPRHIKKIFCLHGPRSKGDIGTKTKGKMNYLVKHHDYSIVWVEEFN